MFYQTNRTQEAAMASKCCFLSLMTLTFDLWPWPSNSSEWGSKHVFRVNLAQILSAIPENFHRQTKKQTDSAKNRTFRSSPLSATCRTANLLYPATAARICAINQQNAVRYRTDKVARWRRGATGIALDLRSVGRGFKSYSKQCCVTTLGKLFTPMCLCYQAV